MTEAEDKKQATPPRPNQHVMDIFIISLMFFAMLSFFDFEQEGSQDIPYSEFKQRLRDNDVESVLIRGDKITGNYRRPIDDFIQFDTTFPPMEDYDLFPLLEENDIEVRVSSAEQSTWTLLLINLLPWLLIIGIFMMSSRMLRSGGRGFPGGGVFSFTKSKARLTNKDDIKVSYDDIAGLKHAKEDLSEVIDFLRNPDKYRAIGAKIPKGILLIGPPGTGKTLLARATAAEAGVPFFSITGSEFVEMFVGVGASRVRDMYKEAREVAPALIFIDEIDSVGRTRSSASGLGNDEREQTLNQILSEMDGFKGDEAIVVIAATNRPDVLDSALTRPGRFDRKVILDLPQREARLEILKVHARNVVMASDIDFEPIAAATVGFSGADLANLINEAALLCAREGKSEVDNSFLERARDKVVLGEKREALMSIEERERTAYHEAGHALTAFHMPYADSLRKVSIIPRGMALGITEQTPTEDKFTYGQHYLEDRLSIMLGGRCAEQLVFDEVSSGAANDLQQATTLARHMISEWGMSDKLGPLSFHSPDESFPGQQMLAGKGYSEHTAELIDEEVSKLIRTNEERTKFILAEHRGELDSIAAALLEKESLSEQDLIELLGHPAAKK
ncbi:MAG: ATP-dependent metallopeptidase FtsH/Yme1/Tma family protein [Pseudohongiella sp.]|nr:ATP-dependent metallopeptidase FtsH/Yme1/Tma family protein [Pseudohongiella sp.]